MRRYALFAGLAAAACAGASPDTGAHAVTTAEISCTLEGANFAGVVADEACGIFRRALAEEGALTAGNRYSVALTARSADSAGAVVSDADGTVIADLDFDVMDTPLSAASWEQFARGVAREVARKHTH